MVFCPRVLRVAFTSDLHVDHEPRVIELLGRRLDELAADVLIVAGDVSHDLARLASSLRELRPHAGRRALFVPGNHELWVSPRETGSSRDRYDDSLADVVTRAGFDYLPAGPVCLDGIVFCGQTGWFDFSLRATARDGEIPLAAYRRKRFGALLWTDGVRVRWPGNGRALHDEELTDLMIERLSHDLERAPPGPRVVVTHHLPFPDLVLVRGVMPWDYLNAFMGSRALGDAIVAAPNVVRVISGHTHARRRAILAGCDGRRLVAEVSPVGYPREYGGAIERRVQHRLSSFVI
jgi:3',5'-cyclic AMP phosphodiesterase CpdA